MDGFTTSLREASTETWSGLPVQSSLSTEHAQRISQSQSARRSGAGAVQQQAALQKDEKRLVKLCEKNSFDRTPADLSFMRAMLRWLCPFFRLWPANLQEELCRLIRVCSHVVNETLLRRGTSPDNLFIILTGRVAVCIPAASSPDASRRASSPVADETLAVLTKGNTFGESMLVGTTAHYADVRVHSARAVLLVLSRIDFVRAFREVMGVRHQERLEFLCQHPLLGPLPAPHLESLADLLHLVFLPAAQQLWPATTDAKATASSAAAGPLNNLQQAQAQRVYFIVEGECILRRLPPEGAGAAEAAAALAHKKTSGSMYGPDTLSRLGATDVCGLPMMDAAGNSLAGAVCIETFTDVTAYFMTMQEFDSLPPSVKQVVLNAMRYKSQYVAGRSEVLSKLDTRRKAATYGAFTYRAGNVMHSSHEVSPAVFGSTLVQLHAQLQHGGGHSGSRPTKGKPLLDLLQARSLVATITQEMQADAGSRCATDKGINQPASRRLPARGAPAAAGATSSSAPPAAGWREAGSPSPLQRTNLRPGSLHPLRQRPQPAGSGGQPLSADAQLSHSGLPPAHWSAGLQRQLSDMAAESPAAPSVASASRDGATQPTADLGSGDLSRLPPTSAAFSRLTSSSDSPVAQALPFTRHDRHAAMFQAAQLARRTAAPRPGTATRLSDGGDEAPYQTLNGSFSHDRQASLRLSRQRLRSTSRRRSSSLSSKTDQLQLNSSGGGTGWLQLSSGGPSGGGGTSPVASGGFSLRDLLASGYNALPTGDFGGGAEGVSRDDTLVHSSDDDDEPWEDLQEGELSPLGVVAVGSTEQGPVASSPGTGPSGSGPPALSLAPRVAGGSLNATMRSPRNPSGGRGHTAAAAHADEGDDISDLLLPSALPGARPMSLSLPSLDGSGGLLSPTARAARGSNELLSHLPGHDTRFKTVIRLNSLDDLPPSSLPQSSPASPMPLSDGGGRGGSGMTSRSSGGERAPPGLGDTQDLGATRRRSASHSSPAVTGNSLGDSRRHHTPPWGSSRSRPRPARNAPDVTHEAPRRSGRVSPQGAGQRAPTPTRRTSRQQLAALHHGPGDGASGGGGGEAQHEVSPSPLLVPPAIMLGYENLDPFAWAALMARVGPQAMAGAKQYNILPKPKW